MATMEEIQKLMTQLNRSYLRILTRMIRGTRFLKKERPPKPISRPRKMILHVRADSPANGTYQSLPLYHKRLQDKWLTQKTGSAKREVSNFLWKDTMESHVLTSTHGCAQVEEKCSFLKTPEDEIGRWSKVHLEGNALALISRLGISDWNDIKSNLQHQFIPRHNNQLLRMQLLKLRQLGDIQMYIHEFQAILNKIYDEMAQLFYFVNKLQHDCRRYVELNQPTTLQSGLMFKFRTRPYKW